MQDNLNYTVAVETQSAEARSEFIWKTYAHVVGAILAFAGISAYLITSGVSARIFPIVTANWLLTLGAFMLVSWGASHVAHRLESKPAQYAAFAVFVFAEAMIFSPLLLLASVMKPGIIDNAAGVTIMGSAGLIAVAMITRKDFSFLRGILVWGGILALVAIASSLLFGWQLGTWFSLGMIGFAGAAVLYDTSNIMHHYPQDKYVAAAMGLFASIALMFWYILQFFMSRD
jgi:FtsH-binding integral membrane protein